MALLSVVSCFIRVHFLEDEATIDNTVFRLHYHVTSTVLFLCCILSAINSFSSHAIKCISSDLMGDYLNLFCWSKPTYTVTVWKGRSQFDADDTVHYYHYYQWMPYILFFQAILFYLPHYIWKNLEHGKVRMLSYGLGNQMSSSKDELCDRQSRLVKYLLDTLHLHNAYVVTYFVCEILNFINVLCNILLMDWFVGGTFSEHGLGVFSLFRMEQSERNDTMLTVFPHDIRCVYRRYGPSGISQINQGMCSLPLNNFNEKMFTFLWLWFIVLAVVSALAMLYTWVIMLVDPIRTAVLKWFYGIAVPVDVRNLFCRTQIGDYFLLHLLGMNINRIAFGEILHKLAEALGPHTTYSSKPTYAELQNDLEEAALPHSSISRRMV